MPELTTHKNDEGIRHSEDIQDIITAVPSWILQWGITLFLAILILIFGLSAFIRYPDIVKTSLRIESPNSPKPVMARTAGKLVELFVKENDEVKTGQLLGYMESTADHKAILKLLDQLKEVQRQLNTNGVIKGDLFLQNNKYELGELQVSYQTFSDAYLSYKSVVNNGFLLKKNGFLQKDLINLSQQRIQLIEQKDIQQKDYVLAKQEYEMHQKLEQEKVETKAEFREAQSKFLSKKSPIVQTEAALISADGNYAAKQKEILELNNQIIDEKAKFTQALNSLISQADDWRNKFTLYATQNGKLSFAGIIQTNQYLALNQEVFYINPGNEQFFGEMAVPQDNMGKVKQGQQVLIKLKSYPFEQYGMIRGEITHIADVPYKDSIFMSKVEFKIKNSSDMKKPIHLKQGMIADAEIITENATIFQRVTWNLLKLVNNK